MTVKERWEDLFGQLLDKLEWPDDTPRPAPADIVLLPHSGGKSAWCHDLHPVLEDVNLHVGGAAIVTVGDGVYHGRSRAAPVARLFLARGE